MQITQKRLVNIVLIGTLGLGSFQIQPAAAQVDRSAFREVAEELDLSRSQMRQVGGIMRGLNSDVEDILTTEQFDLLRSTREQGGVQDRQELQAALDLTDAQALQLAAVREETVAELQSVLTTEQLEKIMEMTVFDQL